MKALLYPEYEQLAIADQSRPQPGQGEVLLRVAACGICGSELEAFRKRSPRRVPPLIMGHEFCGIVEEIGPGVRSLSPGKRVVSHSLFGCGQCARCMRGDSHLCGRRQLFGLNRPGAFAEYVCAPEHCLIGWPEPLPAQTASLAEPLANGVHVVSLSRELNPAVVAILGAGPIGLFCLQAFKSLSSADVIVADLIENRLDVARRLGAISTIDSRRVDFVKEVLSLTGGDGADVIVDAVGSERTKKLSLTALRPGGAAVWIGMHENAIELDSYEVTLAERRVQGSYAATLDELGIAVDLLASGKVDATTWIKTFPLVEGVEAFNRMLDGKGDDIKAILLPAET